MKCKWCSSQTHPSLDLDSTLLNLSPQIVKKLFLQSHLLWLTSVEPAVNEKAYIFLNTGMIILKPFSFVLYLCSWSIEHKWRTSYCSLLKIYLVTKLNILGSQRFWWSWFSSVQFSRSVTSDSLRPHELQHTRPPCPSPTPGFHPNPCPLSRWCINELWLSQ